MSSVNDPVAGFHALVQANKQHEVTNRRRLLGLYLKFLPSSFFSRLENMVTRQTLSRSRLPSAPLYILGHWRSGTSFLQFLLGESPDLVYHSKFRTFFPDSFLLTEKILQPAANALLHSYQGVRAWDKGISLDMSLDTPSEIEVSLLNRGQQESFHWGHVFPKSWRYYFDRYLFMDDISEVELRNWRRAILHLNRKVNLTDPDSRLMVKNPGDTARVKEILELYPRAKFVFLHRDPYDVYYSNLKLWRNILANLSVQDYSDLDVGAAIRYIYARMHNNYLTQRELIPRENRIEISHADLSADPMEVGRMIYDQLGLGDFSQARGRMQAYAEKRSDFQASPYDYHPEEIRAINQEWGFTFDAFGYQRKQADQLQSV